MSGLRNTFADAFKEALHPWFTSAFSEAWPLDLQAFEEGLPIQVFEEAFKEGIVLFFLPITLVWNVIRDVRHAYGT